MNWQLPPYVWPVLLAGAICFILAIQAWRRRSAPGAVPFALLMLAVTGWSAGYTLELLQFSLPGKVFWTNFNYAFIVMVPAAWLIFALKYTDRVDKIRPAAILLLCIEPILTLVMTWTNEYHRLFRTEVALVQINSFVVLDSTFGIAFWIHAVYSYALLVAGTGLLIRASIRSPRLYRGQATATLIGALLPWIGNAVYLLGWSPFDLTPIAFALTGLANSWALFRFRMLDIVPVARDLVIESMSDNVVVLDTHNRIVDCNPAAERLLGCSSSDAIGQPAGQVFPRGWAPVEEYREVYEADEEIVLQQAGEERYFDLTISPLRDRWGRLTGRLIVLRDISERKRAEKALREAKKASETANRSKSEFISLISHELRIPMTFIRGYAELLAEGDLGPVTDEQIEQLKVIESNVERMVVLVSDLSDISHIESGHLRLDLDSVSVSTVVDDVIRSVRNKVEQKDQRIAVGVPDNLPPVWADRTRLAQVLTNLVDNAHKYTPPGETIVIRAERMEGDQDGSGDGMVHISVEDQGIGIRLEDQEAIFQKFFRSDEPQVHDVPGTGLGLSIAKNLVDMQGGDIWFESEWGEGSTFHFTVPVKRPPVEMQDN